MKEIMLYDGEIVNGRIGISSGVDSRKYHLIKDRVPCIIMVEKKYLKLPRNNKN